MPSNKIDFMDYCLRKLGAPVIEINVSPLQVEDRVEEALSFWRDYHYDGSNLIYIKHTVTANDVTRGYIEVDPNLLGVTRVIDSTYVGGSTGSILDLDFQYIASLMTQANQGNLNEYYLARQNLAMIREVLVGRPTIRYNRHANKVYIDDRSFKAGRTFVLEAWAPSNGTDVWNDRWLQNYATALIGAQWGRNLGKFTNVQLMGGIMFNGEQILQMHEEERKKLEDEVINSFGPGLNWYTG